MGRVESAKGVVGYFEINAVFNGKLMELPEESMWTARLMSDNKYECLCVCVLVSGEQAAAQSDRVQSVLREPGRPSADVMRAPALLNVPSSPTEHSLPCLPDTHQRSEPGENSVGCS